MKFSKDNWSVEEVDGQYVLEHPNGPDETFDTLDELVECYPICEVGRRFFMEEDE